MNNGEVFKKSRECIDELQAIGLKQIKVLKEISDENSEDKVAEYRYQQVKYFWKDWDALKKIYDLQLNQHLPTRTMFDESVRVLYLSKIPVEKADDIVRKDFLKIIKLLYSRAKDSEVRKRYLDFWNHYVGSLKINIHDKRIISFPDMPSLLKKLFTDYEQLYSLFSIYSEEVHANALRAYMPPSNSVFGIIRRLSLELTKDMVNFMKDKEGMIKEIDMILDKYSTD
ncbi:hypothetical protein KC669_02765 [Candidatus Dojkabacteria bacterium]|uniref:Uncharacterized protein n=1 Tax=Candidatus Dojkabacteria bacterium TaxID=2099670 RepID=A0A955LBF4_9BACT|nr:hypothetical protein [Candidatus Dojkabacteria bacterium]